MATLDYVTQLKNTAGSDTDIATAVWTSAVRSLTVDPATDAGLANLVWTHSSRTLTGGPGNIAGLLLQPLAVASAISMTTPGITNILNYTGNPGLVLGFGLTVATNLTGGNLTMQFNIQLDGGSVQSILIYNNAQVWTPSALAVCTTDSGNVGGTASNFITFKYGLQFSTSVTIAFNVTATTLATGALTGSVLWAHS